ncbi:inositol monophosphatase [Phytohabitans sp. ZYX-F-186]|uniref:Inositol monophosphatase n=1 Tax=Phytohabitans maris TaxID=3071409 RepID=A0ABU0ZSS9_9ACTN|nr:inositol monophosphatase [Phytohabitans sp. ZYX-F-186]MDQ7909542.1 inositol monophosphatase [Phytohabitans sp. ZYX-F-186]
MSSDLDLAVDAVVNAAGLAMGYFTRVTRIRRERKQDGSIVTEADHAVEAAIRQTLAAARPQDAVLGEEEGQRGDSDRRWIIDPIDGTAMFAEGDDRWLVLLALEVDSQVVASVAAAPAQRRIWWAERGSGGFVADLTSTGPIHQRRIATHGQATSNLATSRFAVVPDPAALPQDNWLFADLAALTTPLPWTTHPALLVATGELDLAMQTRGQVWDFAATSLIVTEAGGQFSGLTGQSHPHTGPALYSASHPLHQAALQHVGKGHSDIHPAL